MVALWTFIAYDVFSCDLCTFVLRVARVHSQLTLELLTAAISPSSIRRMILGLILTVNVDTRRTDRRHTRDSNCC